MAGEWRETTIGNLLARDGGSLKTGPFGTTLKAREYSTEGVPLISVGEVGYGSLRVHDKTPRAPREVVDRLPEYLLEAGDIVFGRKGAVDRSAFVRPEQAGWFLGSDGIRLRLPKTTDARFIAYQLQSPETRTWLGQHATGTTMASLNQAIIQRVPIVVPPLSKQRAIAHILGTLDDKIELNRRMSETLEAMARALFKSWFIDFDPVRRNAARARNQPSPSTPRHPFPAGEDLYRGGYDYAGLVRKARELRAKQTPAEAILWEFVRDRRFMGLKFRRQHQLGDYIADYYCHEHRLVVELDGGIHTEKRAKDHKRAAWMAAQGIQVLRFPNEHFLEDPQSVLLCIAETTLPSPSGGRARGEPEGQLPSPVGRRVGDEGVVGGEAFDHLFPARLVGSELGEIPEGWEIPALGEILKESKERVGNLDVPEYSSTNDGLQLRSERFTKTLAASSAKNKLIREGWLVFGLSRRLLNFGLMRDEVGSVSSAYKVFTVDRRRIVPDFLERMMRLQPNYFYNAVSASSREGQTVSSQGLALLRCVRPPIELQELFYRVTHLLSARLGANEVESRTLAGLRDTLLPKLISGELRAKDVEQLTQE